MRLAWCVIVFPHPAWPLGDGALLMSKGGAQPQTVSSFVYVHLL